MLIPDAFEDSAGRFADKPAFRHNGKDLSYGALAVRARRLASVLLEHGLQPMDRVGILSAKDLHLPVSVYGTLRAGGVFVPIDPNAPAARIDAILRDCGVRFLIAGRSKAKEAVRIAQAHPDLRLIIGIKSEENEPRFVTWDEVETASSQPRYAHSSGLDLAYLMYTSGSTGTPKGLMHTHESGMSYARMSANLYGVGPQDRLGNHAALHFDQATFEYFTGPLHGATTVLIPEDVILFPRDLAALVESERLTIWHSVPSTLVRLATDGGLEERDLGALRWVVFGGEPFPPKHLWRLMDLLPDAGFSNSYGPAEVNQCTFYHVPRERYGSEDALPLGRMCRSAEGLVLDGSDREAEAGTIGELAVRTPTMMSGYWGRPDLNAAAFFERERIPGFREVFYRTGDLVRRDGDGTLFFAGRRDRQVKVRGFRIELDEIENRLTALPDVREAAAITVPDEKHGKKIIGAVVLRPGHETTQDLLRRALSETLPAYALPERIHIVDDFPRTTSGKIDRRAVEALFTENSVKGMER